jgi:hypothetical protein
MKLSLKIISKILGVLVLDFIIIWLWVYQMDPDPSVSIGILLLVPLVFVVNLLLAGVLYLLKKKEYAILFCINSILASIIMYQLFMSGIGRHQNNQLESWEFKKADTTFSLIRWKKTDDFDMEYRTDPGMSVGFLSGKCILKNGEFILTTDSTRYIMKDNLLIGFRRSGDTVKLKKAER